MENEYQMNQNDYNNNYNNNMDNNNNKGSGGTTNFMLGMAMGVLFTLIICVVVLFVVVEPFKGNSFEAVDVENRSQFEEQLNSKLQDIQSCIDSDYYFETNYQDMIDAVCKGYMAGIGDDYACYYTAEEYNDLIEESNGEYYGIGVVVQMDAATGYIKVVDPYTTGPGYEAGIRAGDFITEIEGETVVGMDLNSAVALIKGEEGTFVNVTIYRDGEDFELTVERRKIDIINIEYEMLDNNIGYIAISSFEANTDEQFIEAVESLRDQGATSLIFDVRDNGGGLLDTVVNMLDYLLPEGTIVYTEDNKGNKEYDKSDADCISLPMAVLVNENSASASEIFAGALQDYEKAVIVGKTTFGKGIVQRIYPFFDGTAIKFTVSAYYTPNGRNIHGTGITPDVESTLPTEEEAYEEGILKREYDTQLGDAIEELK